MMMIGMLKLVERVMAFFTAKDYISALDNAGKAMELQLNFVFSSVINRLSFREVREIYEYSEREIKKQTFPKMTLGEKVKVVSKFDMIGLFDSDLKKELDYTEIWRFVRYRNDSTHNFKEASHAQASRVVSIISFMHDACMKNFQEKTGIEFCVGEAPEDTEPPKRKIGFC